MVALRTYIHMIGCRKLVSKVAHHFVEGHLKEKQNTVVPGFRVLGFSALPGFRALKSSDGAWSVHKTLFGFRAPLSQLFT